MRGQTPPPTRRSRSSGGKAFLDLGSWEWVSRTPEVEEEPETEELELPEEKERGPGLRERAARFFRKKEPDGARHRQDEHTTLSYLPGLDGLRALAVIAVLLYHAGLPWIPGGFLGVEIFFVISGYLITALLLAEWRQQGRINLKAFWLRRARRLLPALYLLLVVTLSFAVVFLPGEVARLRDDVLAALGYVTNWLLIFNQESYFDAAGRPSLLKHLWSLAVEEQFYIVWPLLLAGGLALFRPRRLLPVVLGSAVLSAVLMAVLYQPDVDPSRVYYGTDTRAAGLLFGAALAFVWAPEAIRASRGFRVSDRRHVLHRTRQKFRHRLGWAVPRLLDAAGLVALAALVLFCLRFDEFQPVLYRGGLALVALTTVLVIAVVVHPRAQLGKGILGWGPIRWIGLRSYSIYLWHWPVFMVTRPQLDLQIDGLPLLALRLVVTLVLADLSYRFVETPIRRGALERAWRSLREARGDRRRKLGLQWAGAAGTALMICVVLGVALVLAQPPKTPSQLVSKQEVHQESPAPAEQDAPEESEAPETAPAAEPEGEEEADAAIPAENSAVAPVGSVSAIGDSVMLGASGMMEQEISNLVTLDAEIGFQATDVIAILRRHAATGQLGEAVVVQVGNNGPLRPRQLDRVMRMVGDERQVVFVNLKVSRFWERRNNKLITETVEKYPNASLVDWHAASVYRPELFWDDGMHLQPAGEQVYTDLILSHLNGS